MSGQLVVHAGGWVADLEEIKAVPVPERTKTYVPVPHADLIELVRGTLPDFGLEVAREQYALGAKGQQVFGVIDTLSKAATGDYGVSIGLRGSYDQVYANAVLVGSRVFVCDNLAFSGEIVMTRKHTGRVWDELPGLVKDMVARVPEHEAVLHRQIGEMKALQICEADVYNACHRAMEVADFPQAKVGRVISRFADEEQWKRYGDEEGQEATSMWTAWNLFNAFTAVNGERPALTQVRSNLELTRAILDAVGINGEN